MKEHEEQLNFELAPMSIEEATEVVDYWLKNVRNIHISYIIKKSKDEFKDRDYLEARNALIDSVAEGYLRLNDRDRFAVVLPHREIELKNTITVDEFVRAQKTASSNPTEASVSLVRSITGINNAQTSYGSFSMLTELVTPLLTFC